MLSILIYLLQNVEMYICKKQSLYGTVFIRDNYEILR